MIKFLCLIGLFSCATLANLQLDHRIVGGVRTTINSAPYQVSLQNNIEGHICGGSIIDRSYILTAAHCVQTQTIKTLKIRVGSSWHDRGGVVERICAIYPHANYDDVYYDYDIAILKLCNGLNFSSSVLPVALPTRNEPVKDGTTVIASGWGYTSEISKVLSPTLMNVSLIITNQQTCRKAYKPIGRVTGRMICASCKNNGPCDSCTGDSGGPLIANGKLIGIISWGNGCAQRDFPGVYTNVPRFRQWIRNKIKM